MGITGREQNENASMGSDNAVLIITKESTPSLNWMTEINWGMSTRATTWGDNTREAAVSRHDR